MNKPINTKPLFIAHEALENAEDGRRYAARRLADAENEACRDLGTDCVLRTCEADLIAWKGGHIVHMRMLLDSADKRYHEAQAAFGVAAQPLAVAIKAAEGRATARTIRAEHILEELESIERRLAIAKKAMEGITVSVDRNAQKFPNAYKYVPESTHFTAVYKAGSWRITNIFRGTCTTCENTVELTDAAKVAIIDRFSRNV